MAEGTGSPDYKLTDEQIESIIIKGTPETLYKGKKVLVLTPDATRTSPLPLMIRLLKKIIGAKAEKLDFMVALGTHQPLKEEEKIGRAHV